jgi:hypothetical protein
MLDTLLQKYKPKQLSAESLINQARYAKPEIKNQENEDLYKEELDELIKKNEEIMSKYCTLYKEDNENQSNFKIEPLNKQYQQTKQRRLERQSTTGKSWFDMKATKITPEIENDLKAIQLKHIIDPSRFYKRPDSNGLPKFFQIGRFHTELTMGKKYRMLKKDVKNTLAEEFLQNDEIVDYSKRKFNEIQSKKIGLGKKRRRMNDMKLKMKNKKSKSKRREYIKK